jgi:hypothetical protein
MVERPRGRLQIPSSRFDSVLTSRIFYVFKKYSSDKLFETSIKIYQVGVLTCSFFDKVS